MIDTRLFDTSPFDPGATYVPVLKLEPGRYDAGGEAVFDTFAVGAVMRGASDITLQSDAIPRIQINGGWYCGTKKHVSSAEIVAILSRLWKGTDAASILRQGRALDFRFEVRVDRRTRQGYRVNATPIMRDGTNAIEITLRGLPNKTPTLDTVRLEPELRDHLDHRSGIVVIAGATGQGKSTTMAAITRMHLENKRGIKIADFQAPIEFTYADLLDENDEMASMIGQSEIGEGRNLPTFADGIRSAMRRAPQIINVGEARDRETMSAAIEACLTGHLVNTTTHAGSVAEALRRMASVFPPEEREGRAFDLITSLQLVVVQHLVRTGDDKDRVAVREYLRFDDDVRDRFTSTPVTAWTGIVSALMERTPDGVLAMPLWRSAQDLVREGRITDREARRFAPRNRRETALEGVTKA